MRTALYRHFDAAGQLLYVGISLSAVQRLAQHKSTADWFAQIARVDVEWLPTRADALRAETKAIADEDPLHNRVRPGVRRRPAVVCAPASFTGYVIKHMGSGRVDGNYFDPKQAAEMLDWWTHEFPGEQFELRHSWGSATPELRAFDYEDWRRAAA